MKDKEDTIEVPKYILKRISDTLNNVSISLESHKKETCLDRDIIMCLICTNKLLDGEPITGMERFENLK